MIKSLVRTIATLMLVTLAVTARAQLPPVSVVEASIETAGSGVHFPSTLSGKLIVQGCPQCVDQALQLDAHTQFYLNGRSITFAQLSSAALGAADKSLTVHYRLKDKVVTRVDLTEFAS